MNGNKRLNTETISYEEDHVAIDYWRLIIIIIFCKLLIEQKSAILINFKPDRVGAHLFYDDIFVSLIKQSIKKTYRFDSVAYLMSMLLMMK